MSFASEVLQVQGLLKSSQWKSMISDREIILNAQLKNLANTNMKKYSFYTAMLVKNRLSMTRAVLTDYKVYSQLIPYIDYTEYSVKEHLLRIEGGIWSFRLKSKVYFQEVKERWIHYEVTEGHFSGLTGDIYFENLQNEGTVVYLKGEKEGIHWPPRFVIEQGAEIVFGFTAKRMRSYIENQKNPEKGVTNHGELQGQQIPQPRSHL